MTLASRRTLAVGTVVLSSLLGMAIWSSRGGTRAEDLRTAGAVTPHGRITIADFSGEDRLRSQIRDHSWEVFAVYSDSGGGAVGKVTFKPFSITRNISWSSPAIALAVAEGTHFPRVTVQIYKTGTTEIDATYVLSQVVLTRIVESGGSGQTEVIEFDYGRISWTQEGETFCYDVDTPAEC